MCACVCVFFFFIIFILFFFFLFCCLVQSLIIIIIFFFWDKGLVTKAGESRYEVQCDDAEHSEWFSDLDVAAHVSEESQLRVVSDHHDVCQGLSPLHPNLLGAASPLGLASATKVHRHFSSTELSQVALLARINRMKALVLQALSAFNDYAERASVSGPPLCSSFKRAYSNLIMQLRHVNHLEAPVLRDMPNWPGAIAAPRSETQSLRDLPAAWLRKLSARCEQDASNTLEIATKAMLQKKPSFVFLPESKRLVSNAVMLAHCVQQVASLHELYLPSEISVALDMALTRIRPEFPENNDAYHQVQSLVSQIVGFLSDPDEKSHP